MNQKGGNKKKQKQEDLEDKAEYWRIGLYLSGRRSFPWGRRHCVDGESSWRRHRHGRLAGQATLLKPKHYSEGKDWMNEYKLVLGPPGSLPCNWSWVRITLATGPQSVGGSMEGRMPRERKSWNNSWVLLRTGDSNSNNLKRNLPSNLEPL